MLGFGWCHLLSDRTPLATASLQSVGSVEARIEAADKELWASFRVWMQENSDPFTQWQLFESINFRYGLLTYCLSRNHRTSSVWSMLEWIAENGAGSYGLFYCHDDEDAMDDGSRKPPMDYDNVFRVHRLLNGVVTELADPFFGPIEGGIFPVHPFNRADL